MTDEMTNVPEDETDITPTPEMEKEMLKERAKQLDLRVSPNIGLDTLREKVAAALKDDADKDAPKDETGGDEPAEQQALTPQQRKMAIREKQRKEQLKLVRLRISNLNPDKSELPGEIFTVCNKYLGNIRKYIPYGEATDEGYHVPWFIYEQMRTRKFLQKRTKQNRQTGQIEVKTRWVQEFALEVLDPLTPEELKKLANQQRAAVGMDET